MGMSTCEQMAGDHVCVDLLGQSQPTTTAVLPAYIDALCFTQCVVLTLCEMRSSSAQVVTVEYSVYY